MKNHFFFLIGLVSLSLLSCVDEAGEGGTSVIQGKVYRVLHPNDVYSFKTDTNTVETDSFRTANYFIDTDTLPAAKEDVYIVYGNQLVYGDKMETGYDGTYRFKYLTKGTYNIYAYSTSAEGLKLASFDTVTVKTGETKEAQNIYIHQGKMLDKSYIKGTVLARYYDKGYLVGYYDIPACEARVFIRVKGAAYQFNEVRTGSDGVFMFQELDPGKYEVFVSTEKAGEKILTPVIVPVTIESKGIIKTIKIPFHIIINA